MRAVFVLGVVSLSFACARGQQRVEPPHAESSAAQVSEIVKWDTELSDDAPGLVLAFIDRAEHYGCAILKADNDAAVADCDGVRIAMAKSSKMVSVGCRGVSLDECRALFRRVVTSREADGSTAPPPAPPPSEPGTSI